MQGEELGATSRHQAAAVGGIIYIHNHRTTSSILALDTQASPPKLTRIPISTAQGYPASRHPPPPPPTSPLCLACPIASHISLQGAMGGSETLVELAVLEAMTMQR